MSKQQKRERAKRYRRKWREVIFARDGYRCAYCGQLHPASRLSVDHFWPSWLGGTHEPSNMVTACLPCNQLKSNLPPLFFRKHRKALEKAMETEPKLFWRLQQNHPDLNVEPINAEKGREL